MQGTSGISLEHKAKARWKERSVCLYSAFPSLFSYGIWWARNNVIFNHKLIPPEVTSTLVIQWAREHRSQEKEPKIRVLVPPEINKNIPWAFFNGANQGDPPLGGSGGVLYLSDNHKIQARFSLGHCTNNKLELVALHLVLNLAINKNITQLQVFWGFKNGGWLGEQEDSN